VTVHPSLDAAFEALVDGRVYAFTTLGTTTYTDIAYQPGDILMFGTEPTGLPHDALKHPRVTEQVRLPMLEGRRSMNLANCAAVAVYEAWRQHGFSGAV
jgi:tRNA (cytidine/uridine-2'-O-)-methyltransferase